MIMPLLRSSPLSCLLEPPSGMHLLDNITLFMMDLFHSIDFLSVSPLYQKPCFPDPEIYRKVEFNFSMLGPKWKNTNQGHLLNSLFSPEPSQLLLKAGCSFHVKKEITLKNTGKFALLCSSILSLMFLLFLILINILIFNINYYINIQY